MRNTALLLLATVVASAACTDDGLGLAGQSNVEDTVSIGALTGSGLDIPSGFSAAEGVVVHTDRQTGFDIIYEILPDHRHVFIPLAGIGLAIANGTNPGLQKVNSEYLAVKSAPTSGYSTTDSLQIAVGDVIVIRSRVVCYLGVPQYAKLKILSFDEPNRQVRFAFLADINCGYRNLEPGVPLE